MGASSPKHSPAKASSAKSPSASSVLINERLHNRYLESDRVDSNCFCCSDLCARSANRPTRSQKQKVRLMSIDNRCREQRDVADQMFMDFKYTQPGSEEQIRALKTFSFLIGMWAEKVKKKQHKKP